MTANCSKVLGRAVHIGTQVQHRGGAALGVGHLGGNGRAVNAIQRLEQIAGNGHQGARVAGRHRGGSRAILDLLDGNAHGRILLAAQATSTGSSMATTSVAATTVARSCEND
jgi:hypothetical protein